MVRGVEASEEVRLKFLQGKRTAFTFRSCGMKDRCPFTLGPSTSDPSCFLQAGFSILSLWSCCMIPQREREWRTLPVFPLRPVVFPYTLRTLDGNVH